MNPKQFEIFLQRNDEATERAVGKFVNGKIDKLSGELHEHMARVEPVIKAFEDNLVIDARNQKAGDKVIYWGKVAGSVVLVLGIAWAAFRLGVTQIINRGA